MAISLSTGILTSPRKVCYLGQSLDSYFKEFDATPVVFAEPGAAHYFNESRTVRVDRPVHLGQLENFRRGLAQLLETDADWLLMCEDDIQWMPGSGPRLLSFLEQAQRDVAKIGAVSPYCSQANVPEGLKLGWWMCRIHPKWGWCGNLAMAYPRVAAQEIVDATIKNLRYVDYLIAEFLYKMDRRIFVHLPTDVLHIGEFSTLVDIDSKFRDHECRKPFTG